MPEIIGGRTGNSPFTFVINGPRIARNLQDYRPDTRKRPYDATFAPVYAVGFGYDFGIDAPPPHRRYGS